MSDGQVQGIAVVGMSGRFPGAGSVEAFWHNLREGISGISHLTREELLAAGVSEAELADPRYVRAAGMLGDAELFEAELFGLTAREAEVMDPQQRVFLECAWEALEDAGYDPARYPGWIGVYAGAGVGKYLWLNVARSAEALAAVGAFQALISNDKDYLATQVAYRLNLRGPSVGVQTACSTSLVAVHLACQALLCFECDLALAGGVSLNLPERRGYLYEDDGLSSPDGICRPFDAAAVGTLRGNGAGIVVLRRLADALADGDRILAVLRGSAINNDGSAKVGFTAPSVAGQTEVIAAAQAIAGVEPETIDYVEAHGTGTTLGDPIEMAALVQVFGGDAARGACGLGSVKSNVGHLDAAAGVTGLIKTVLALSHGEIPPSLHFERPNPKLDLGPFEVVAERRPWPATPGRPRRAGVSAFGIGGTNAHAVLEEAPEPEPGDAPAHPWVLLPLSARTETALAATAARLAAHLRAHPEIDLADAAWTLQVGRRELGRRRAIVARGREEVCALLDEVAREPRAVAAEESFVGDLAGEADPERLARLWERGAAIDWQALHEGERRRRASLPGYPFERRRYWIEGGGPLAGAATAAAADARRPLAEWFHLPSWKRTLPPAAIQKSAQLLRYAQNDDREGPAQAPSRSSFVAGDSRWATREDAARDAEARRCLILADGLGLGEALGAALRARGWETVLAFAEEGWEALGPGRYRVRPGDAADHARLWAELAAGPGLPRRVLHLWNVTGEPAGDLDQTLDRSLGRSFYSLFHLARSFAARPGSPVELTVFSNRLHAIDGGDRPEPAKAALLGICRVLPQEQEHVRCRSVDLDVRGDLGSSASLLELCLSEAAATAEPGAPGVVAWRGLHRWAPSWEEVALSVADPAPALRPRGVYLITGGLGGVGLEVARLLAESVRARLVLAGRRVFPPRDAWDGYLAAHGQEDATAAAIRRLHELEALGAEVAVESADVLDAAQMELLRSRIEARFGAVDGVFHAAGVPGGGLLQAREAERAAAVLAPKVQGTLVLARVFAGAELMVLFSSLNAILGGIGQADYAAANAFLDAFAAARAAGAVAGPRRIVSIDWDAWRQAGMAADTGVPEELRAWRDRQLAAAIRPEEGREALARVLAGLGSAAGGGLPQVAVSIAPLARSVAEAAELRLSAALAASAAVPRRAHHPRPAVAPAYAPPATPREERLAALWQELLGIEPIGRDDGFFELGGHSLLAGQLAARLRDEAGVELPIQAIFTYPTPALLAAALDELAASAPAQDEPEVPLVPLPRQSRRIARDVDDVAAEPALSGERT